MRELGDGGSGEIAISGSGVRFRSPHMQKAQTFRTLAVAAVTGGVALGVFVVLAIGLPAAPEDGYLTRYLIIINATLLLSLFVFAFLRSDRRSASVRAKAQAEDKLVSVLGHIFRISSARAVLSASTLDGSLKGLRTHPERTADFLQLLVNETRTMFEEYIEQPCGVAIKLILAEEIAQKPSVVTFVRDELSGPVRSARYGELDAYGFEEHSPFLEIVSGSKGDFYLENDLRAAARAGRYRNANPHWRRFYNATLVVPIKAAGKGAGEEIAGFLCVDSLYGRFNSKVCPLLARIVANSAYLALYEVSALESQKVALQESAAQGARLG